MAEKYPTLPDRKQHVLSIETARWTTQDGHERAVVVTAERHHLVVFVSQPNGAWASFDREHRALDRTPTSPAGTAALRWSGQVAIASDPRTLLIAYKRRIRSDTQLWIDRFHLDDTGQSLVALPADPVALPLSELGLDGSGFWLRAAHVNGRLHLVTQGLTGTDPSLTLLSTNAPLLDSVSSDAFTWESAALDTGGYDLDALVAGSRLEVVHRREPGYVTAPQRWGPFIDGALLTSDPPPNYPPLESMQHPLVRVTVDLASSDPPRIDDTLPPLEHPQILGADPFLVVGDRLRAGIINTNKDGEGPFVELRVMQSDKAVVRKRDDAWLSDALYRTSHERVPRQLSILRGAQILLGRTDEHFEIGTLMPQHPVALLRYQTDEKQDLLVLAHDDRETGALVASTFHLTLQGDPVWLDATRQGFAVLDIGREQLGGGRDGTPFIPYPHENLQFNPLLGPGIGTSVDEIRVRGPRSYVNTMGGAVSAPIERGSELFAYVDMGDAGLRVFHLAEVEPPPPLAPPTIKRLEPNMVPGPGGGEHVWIDLQAANLRDLALSGYRAPYAEFLGSTQDPDTRVISNAITFLLLISAAPGLDDVFLEPPSLQGSLQPSLDLLPLALALSGNWDLDVDGFPLLASDVDLTESSTLDIASFMADTSGSVRVPFTDGAFSAELVQTPATVFPGAPVTFRIATEEPDPSIEWRIETPELDEDDEEVLDGEGNVVIAVEILDVSGTAMTRSFETPNRSTVVAIVTNESGESVRLERLPQVGESLWNTLWSSFDTITQSESFSIAGLELSLFQYELVFSVDASGARQSVHLSWRDDVPSRVRFVGGGIEQGRIDHQIGIGFRTSGVSLTGVLAAAIAIESVEGSYLYGRQYTPSVLTSDQRSFDPVRRNRFSRPVETVQSMRPVIGGKVNVPEPAALAMKPVSDSTLTVDELEVQTSLASPARIVGWLVGALLALGLAGAAVGSLIAAMVAAGAATGILVGLGLAGLMAAALVLGLTWLLIEVVAPPLLQSAARNVIRENLEAGSEGMRAAFDRQGLLDYAGEGLAEGLAREVIEAAGSQGQAVDAPEDGGRGRVRGSFFETIFVTDGRCRVRVRIP